MRKLKKMCDNDAFVPIGYCPTCEEILPIQITDMVHKEKQLEISILSCPKCEYVLNLDGDFDLEWVTESWLLERGWFHEGRILAWFYNHAYPVWRIINWIRWNILR